MTIFATPDGFAQAVSCGAISSRRTDPRSKPDIPFERTGMYNGKDGGSISYYNWFVYQFWRVQVVQQEVARVAQTAIEFPPMQKGASFNLEAVKEQIEKAIQSQRGK